MKEEDLDKHLKNIIIDGLIKEAEQDNADFEAAMRNINDEDFEEIIQQPVYEYEQCGASEDDNNHRLRFELVKGQRVAAEDNLAVSAMVEDGFGDSSRRISPASVRAAEESPVKARRNFRPWIVSAISAAAVILVVLIPSINYMNGKLCDSALYASSAYATPSRGSLDVTNMTDAEVSKQLPELERRYEDGLQANDTDEFREAGWDLTMAYLKLHKKRDAVRVLKVLAEQYKGSDFGTHCAEMLKQLD